MNISLSQLRLLKAFNPDFLSANIYSFFACLFVHIIAGCSDLLISDRISCKQKNNLAIYFLYQKKLLWSKRYFIVASDRPFYLYINKTK